MFLFLLVPPAFAAPPTINTNPASQTVHTGNSAAFIANISGTAPLTYKWSFNGAPLTDDGHRSGTGTTNLVITNVQAADVGAYRLVVTNMSGSITSSVATLDINLSLADSFNPGANNYIQALAETGDGRVLVAGQFTNLAGQAHSRIGRLIPDGTADTSYNPSADATVFVLAMQDNGQGLAGGDFINFSGQPTRRLGRMNSDGGADGGYNPWPDNTVRSLAVQPDGLVLVGGSFNLISLVTRPYLARLQSGSIVDGSFAPVLNGSVNAIALQSDGKVLIGGTFTQVNGMTNNLRIARVNADGTLDTNFVGTITNAGSVNAILVQPDGRILIGGEFTLVNGQSRVAFARLNANGSLDTSFQADVTGGYPAVNSLSLQADGKIYVGGSFGNIAGQTRPGIARLMPDGSGDPKFYPSQDSALVSAQALQADGKLVVAGFFANMGEQSRNKIARLNPTDPATNILAFDTTSITWQRGGSATEVWRATFELSTNGTDWTALGNGTRISNGWQLTGLNLPVNAIVRARGWVCGGSWFVESFAGIPVITSQSSSVTLNMPISSFALSATATGGTPLSYQWLKNGVPLTDADNFTGTQSSSMTFTNLYGGNTGQYRIVVSNAWGSVTGAVITLNVVDPRISSQTGSQYVNAGQNVSFTVNAAGSNPLQYQWRFNGQPLPAATNASLSITNAQSSDAGNYTVVVSSPWGSVTGGVSTLTVNLAFPDSFTLKGSAVAQWALQPDGKILVAGLINPGSNNPKYLARLNPDGSIDSSLNYTNVAVDVSSAYALALLTNGQILIAGPSRQSSSMWRLNHEGTLDATFSNVLTGNINALVLPADNSLFVGGTISYLKPSILTNVARLQPNGAVNTNFLAGIDGTIYALAQQPDGKLLAGGDFSKVSGQTNTRIARLTTNAAPDTGFFATANNSVYCLVPQTDGKILVAGNFTTLDGTNINRLGRLYADGSMDTNFNPNVNGIVNSLALQTDGKILLGGTFTSVSGLTRNRLARLNPDGSLDLLFNPNINGAVNAIGLQPDGALLVGGSFTQIAGLGRTNLARLPATDTAIQALAYNGNVLTWSRSGTSPEVWRTTFEFSINGLDWSLLGAGTRIAGGWQLSGVSLPVNADVRARGFVQTGQNNAASWFVESSLGPALIVSQPNGGTNLCGTPVSFWVAGGGTPPLSYRWLKGGQPLTDGGNISGAGTMTLVLTNLLGGDGGNYSVIVSNASGSVTSSIAVLSVIEPIIKMQPVAAYTNVGQTAQFNVTALGTPPFNYQWRKNGVVLGAPDSATLTLPNVQSNDIASYSVMVSTSYGSVTSSAAALTLNLIMPDALTGAFDDEVRSVAVQADGKFVVGGNFSYIGTDHIGPLARLNDDGSVDHAFASANSSTDAAVVQPDGNILLGGWFTAVNGTTRSRVARVFPDGSLDSTVSPTLAFNDPSSSEVESVLLQPDGKVVFGGWFKTVSGQSRLYVGRLNTNGTVDSFNPAANDLVQAMALQPDGKVIIAGRFTSLGGQTRNRIGRVNADGTLDTGFNPNANNVVSSVVVQPDGKILVGGSFTSIAGASRTYLARLNSDGSIDSSFNVSLGGGVSSIALQADGSIILAGPTAAAGQTRYGIARVSGSGALDPTWSPQVAGGISGVSIQADGKVLLCGSFTSVCGLPRSCIARLEVSGPATHQLVCDPAGLTWWRGGTSPEVTGVKFQTSSDGINWTNLGTGTKVNGGWRLSTNTLSIGAYVRAHGFASGGRWNGSLSLIADTNTISALTPPLILTSNGSINFQTSGANAGFSFTWQGLTGQNVVLEASTNLLDWIPLQTNVANGTPSIWLDSGATNRPSSFYRLEPR